MRGFFWGLIHGIGFIFILSLGAFSGIIKGVWEQSDRMARIWELEWSSIIKETISYSPLFFILRLFAFILMILYLLLLSWGIFWILVT